MSNHSKQPEQQVYTLGTHDVRLAWALNGVMIGSYDVTGALVALLGTEYFRFLPAIRQKPLLRALHKSFVHLLEVSDCDLRQVNMAAFAVNWTQHVLNVRSVYAEADNAIHAHGSAEAAISPHGVDSWQNEVWRIARRAHEIIEEAERKAREDFHAHVRESIKKVAQKMGYRVVEVDDEELSGLAEDIVFHEFLQTLPGGEDGTPAQMWKNLLQQIAPDGDLAGEFARLFGRSNLFQGGKEQPQDS